MNPYDELKRAIEEHDTQFVKKPKRYRGQLGYTVDGVYSVIEKTNTAQYRVRLDNKSFITAFHNGKCAPQPDLSVWVIQDELGRYYIESVDVTTILSTNPNNPSQAFVAPHSHSRGSGMEFPIDPRLFSHFQVRPVTGLEVYVNGGAYEYEGHYNWFGGDTVNLSSSVPSISGKQRWVILSLNHNTASITVTNGAMQSITSPLTIEQIELMQFGGYPIGAIRLRHGQTSISETDIEALHILSGGFPRHNYNSNTSPTPSDDEDDGFGYGSQWFDQAGQVIYTCIDPTAGNAVWISGASGSVPINTTKRDIYIQIPLYEETLTSAGTFNVSLSSFETCDSLVVDLMVRGTNNNTVTVLWAVNGDTTASNYKRQVVQGNTSTAQAGTAQDRAFAIYDGANSVSNTWTYIKGELPNYRNTSQNKVAYSRTSQVGSLTSSFIQFLHSIWHNTSAITQLAFSSNVGNFASGSSIKIYGIKKIQVVTEVSGTQQELFPIELDYEETIPTNRQIVLSHINIVSGGDLIVNGVALFVGDDE